MKSNNRKLRFHFLNYMVITFALSIAASQAAVADSCTTIDTDKQTITFPVVLDSDEYPSGEVTNRLIKYQFKDGFFRKVTS